VNFHHDLHTNKEHHEQTTIASNETFDLAAKVCAFKTVQSATGTSHMLTMVKEKTCHIK
jgi:hypothetical protein